MACRFRFGVLGCVIALAGIGRADDAKKLSIAAEKAEICAGESVKLTASGDNAANVKWKDDQETGSSGSFNPTTGANTVYTAAGNKSASVAPAGIITITAGEGRNSATVTLSLTGPCAAATGGEVTRAVVGFEQVGASGANSDQKFFFDFFITRPVSFRNPRQVNNDQREINWGTHLRWWGNVRVASYPQQINSEVVKFAQQFATNAGNVKVNQLAQNVNFITGPELRIAATPALGSFTDSSVAARFLLTAFVGGGATGPMNPTDNVTVFEVPDRTTPQYAALTNQFGAVGSKYVAFLPQARDRFLREWRTGLRLYTFFARNNAQATPLSVPPATVEFSLGQNEMVTNGHLRGIVGHVEAVYPFALGDRTKPDTLVIYFFGEATTAYTKPQSSTPLLLAPAMTNNNPVPLTDPGVTAITVPANRRDTYRIGIGVDLLRVWNKLSSATQSKQ